MSYEQSTPPPIEKPDLLSTKVVYLKRLADDLDVKAKVAARREKRTVHSFEEENFASKEESISSSKSSTTSAISETFTESDVVTETAYTPQLTKSENFALVGLPSTLFNYPPPDGIYTSADLQIVCVEVAKRVTFSRFKEILKLLALGFKEGEWIEPLYKNQLTLGKCPKSVNDKEKWHRYSEEMRCVRCLRQTCEDCRETIFDHCETYFSTSFENLGMQQEDSLLYERIYTSCGSASCLNPGPISHHFWKHYETSCNCSSFLILPSDAPNKGRCYHCPECMVDVLANLAGSWQVLERNWTSHPVVLGLDPAKLVDETAGPGIEVQEEVVGNGDKVAEIKRDLESMCDCGKRSKKGGLSLCRLCFGCCHSYPPVEESNAWHRRGTCYTFYMPSNGG